MKLLIATGLYAPDIGGPATYIAFLERHLPSLGFTLEVVPFGGVRKYPKILRHILYTFQLVRRSRGRDVVYALDTVSVGVPALIASVLTGKPLYLRVPGDYAWEQGQQRCKITETLDEYLVSREKPLLVRVLSWFQRKVAEHATKIIVPSEYMRGVVGAWGIRGEKVHVIHSAVNPVAVRETRDELRARFRYEGFVVVTAARLVPWKGVEALIDAVASIRASGILVRLEIVGDGSLREHLAEHVESIGAGEYVHLRGREDKRVLAERINASDAFVLNTSYEGLSHQLLEVMDIGVPIVTTPVGGNPELVEDGETGLLVPFNATPDIVKALERLRTDTGLRTKLVENARKRVLDFREEKIVGEVARVLGQSS